ncbi:endonuclease domain-containing protein [Microbacterium sp. RD1]|uniref:endonuclease domain-containing protein n=1 Tax=Microbacterium sp. RD1 TaxID=3457313 RepID=UPI003FA54940
MLMRPDQAYFHADLKSWGLSQGRITELVRSNDLLRPRQGVYLHPASSAEVVDAARIGGLVGCTTVLREYGVFVLDRAVTHVHVPTHATRLRTPKEARIHWAPLHRPPDSRHMRVGTFDALLQALICQAPRAAIATLDSALHLGVVDERDLDELFAVLPRRRRVLRGLIHGRAESGSETFVRLLLRTLDLSFECQVWIAGVGRVDFLVAGWLVIECDSRAFHDGWEAHVADRRRDILIAERGYACIRPIAADIFADTAPLGRAIVAMLERLGPRTDNIPDASASAPRRARPAAERSGSVRNVVR